MCFCFVVFVIVVVVVVVVLLLFCYCCFVVVALLLPPVQRVQHKNIAFLVYRHDGDKKFGWRCQKMDFGPI